MASPWPAPNQTYVPSFDLPESPRTPGFEGSVQYAYENVGGHLAFRVEVFDDLGRVVARSYSFMDKPFDAATRLQRFCSTVDSEWGMVSFTRAFHTPGTPRPPTLINRYSRITPQRMKLDPVIAAATRAFESRARDNASVRISDPSVASVVTGAGGGVPDERGTE